MFGKSSLQFRIFLSMILLVVLSFIVIALVTIEQYRKQSVQYHNERLFRKEEQIKAQIQYVFSQTTYPVETQYIPLIFKNEIYQIANIQNVNFNLYDLQGNLLKSSQAVLDEKFANTCISDTILEHLNSSLDKRFIKQQLIDNKGYQSSYSYVNDNQFKPIVILNIPNFENDSFNETSLKGSLLNLTIAYTILLILTGLIAFLISKYITKSLKTIEQKLTQTQLLQRNEKIILENPSTEISQLISAYNSMVDQIEESKIELAKTERERAWREMAKQIAHEIKNPLTPMRLTIQNFQRRFEPTALDARKKLNEFSETLIQHVDTLSNIASAFSSFTAMPEENREYLDINSIIKRTIDIFNKNYILFSSQTNEIIAFVDKNQINRLFINLLKNAVQATENIKKPLIEISTSITDSEICISVKDNGIGIEKSLQEKIFEPKFTTKSTGSGLGLAMVKNIVENYKGRIVLTSEKNQGAVFVIFLPKS